VTVLLVVVVPSVVVLVVVVVGIVDVVPKVVVGGLMVTVGGCVSTPTVSVVLGEVETTGIEVPGSLSLSSRVAATATIAPATSATSRSAARAAQSQSGEPLDHISWRLVPYGEGRRMPHSRQYSW
jgi:hypothetical protein